MGKSTTTLDSPPKKDLTGLRSGRLVVESFAGRQRNGKGKQLLCRWNCRCDCGNRLVVQGTRLKGKGTLTKSCGCLLREMNRNRTMPHQHERRKWRGMIQHNSANVCDRWKDFDSFFADMGECPDGLCLVRKDSDRNYEPGNCSWDTRGTITFNGETLSRTKWARRTGISDSTIASRFARGWSVEDALTIPSITSGTDLDVVVQIREDRAAGMTNREVAAKYNMAESVTSSIGTGRVHKNISGPITRRVVRAEDQRTTYSSWLSMISRCYNPNHPSFLYYGGRTPPTTVHKEWRDSFDVFLDYMGLRPSGCDGGIDRWPDNDGSYEPGNVRWSTQKEQMRNRRDNVFVMYQGEEWCITDLVELAVVSKQTLYTRILSMGWDTERALTTPADPRYEGRKSRGPITKPRMTNRKLF